MENFYYKHYITVDDSGCITDGFSSAFKQPSDTDICINEQGGYQFRIFAGGEENPRLKNANGTPLYRWNGVEAAARTAEEIAADSAPDLETIRTAKLDELSAAAQAAIVAGCDVTLSDGTTGHISLTPEDQINLSTAQAAVQAGASGYPYHLDGQLCKVYSAADILIMGKAAVAHILYHTTYCNHLRAWAQRVTTADELPAITYGAALPDDLKANMEAIISAASA